GRTTTQPVPITQPASALRSSISAQTNVACFGDSPGFPTLRSSDLTSPYSYAIDGLTFRSSGTFSNLAAGGYTVTVKDSKGCTTTQPVTIILLSSALGSSISAYFPARCSCDLTGSVTVAGSGGTSPYSYAIDGVT